MLYFQDVEGVEASAKLMSFEPKVQQGDFISVNVSAIDAEAALPFNLYETPVIGSYTASLKPLDYLVDTDGNINFPVLGTTKVEGLTIKEFSARLTEKFGNYIKSLWADL